ncbi:MAG: hypothetical protein IAF02_00670 [Anaerolineae bacterium]|nr:hypothetical protein [Anaerolineae bacterium]
MSFQRVLRGGFVLLVAGTAVIILLILSGIHDPKPIGALVGERPLFSQNVTPQTPRITWLEEAIPDGSYSVRLTAVQEAGITGRGMDVGYGLVLGSDEAHVAVAVSPLGYLSVWQKTDQKTDIILPWQPWPHVQRDMASNEIWLDVADGNQLTIRINREWLWTGEIDQPSGQIGLVAESLGETAVVNFQTLEIFEE